MPIIEVKFGIFFILTLCNEIQSWMSEIWMISHFISVGNWNIVNL